MSESITLYPPPPHPFKPLIGWNRHPSRIHGLTYLGLQENILPSLPFILQYLRLHLICRQWSSYPNNWKVNFLYLISVFYWAFPSSLALLGAEVMQDVVVATHSKRLPIGSCQCRTSGARLSASGQSGARQMCRVECPPTPRSAAPSQTPIPIFQAF